jgi:uncharacterized OB-fold protein
MTTIPHISAPYPGVLPPDIIRLAPNLHTEPFWAAAVDHRLVLPRCVACGTYRLPPGPFCWNCRSQEVAWEEHDGAGELYSFTVIRHAVIPDVKAALPLVAAVVQLDNTNECRLIGNLIDVTPEDVKIGSRVSLVWYDAHDDVSVPCFRLAE